MDIRLTWMKPGFRDTSISIIPGSMLTRKTRGIETGTFHHLLAQNTLRYHGLLSLRTHLVNDGAGNAGLISSFPVC
jgi:hypothetical protein